MRKNSDVFIGRIVRAAWVTGEGPRTGFQLRAMSCISVHYKRATNGVKPKNNRELNRLIAG